MATDDEHVKPGLELRRERIIAADLELLAGNARNVIAGTHDNIAIRIGEGIERGAQQAIELIGRVDIGVIEVAAERAER